ncbi:MAG: guanylate kinase [bacterium]|jgi:guanylate kinase
MDEKYIKFKDKGLHLDGKPRGLIFAVSAPSGAGKTTLCNMLLREFKDIRASISFTTRVKRQGEEDGISYHFINDSEFDRMIKEDEFIEWANVFGKRYGTAHKSIFNPNSLFDILLEIDVQGVEKLIKIYGFKNKTKRLVTIFITPPSYKDLSERLKKRGDMDDTELNKRLNTAYEEIKKSVSYDYIVTNDDLNEAYLKLKSIVIAERCKNFKKDY